MTNVETIDTECTHHWKLAPPSGELTYGTCNKCGTEKEFTGETSYRIGRGGKRE